MCLNKQIKIKKNNNTEAIRLYSANFFEIIVSTHKFKSTQTNLKKKQSTK
jgi:hypothetical protein